MSEVEREKWQGRGRKKERESRASARGRMRTTVRDRSPETVTEKMAERSLRKSKGEGWHMGVPCLGLLEISFNLIYFIFVEGVISILPFINEGKSPLYLS